jgi:MipA family protein
MQNLRPTAFILFLAVLTPLIGFAQRPDLAEKKDLTYSLGAGLLIKPTYQGSDEYDFWPVPYFELRYQDWLVVSPWQGVQLKQTNGPWNYGLSFGFDFGRDEDDGEQLRGMGDIRTGFTLSPEIGYDAGWAQFGLRSRHEITGVHGGFELEASVGKRWFFREYRTLWIQSLTLTYADQNYLNTYFGVDEPQSERSGYATYTLESGIKSYGLSTTLIRTLTKNSSIVAIMRLERFADDVRASPVVASSFRAFGGIFWVRTF